ncbi:MAG: mechanosensitive ion channel family protein [Desulfobacteraceae bacterium]|nr:mechanosensitive ion channel family protein [Desulfobacteraceae bacterium]
MFARKLSKAAFVVVSLLFLAIACAAQCAESPKADAKPETAQPADAKEKPGDQPTTLPEDLSIPIKTEKLDEAGQELGKKIDAVGAGASVKFGRWINAKAFGGISWLKLIACIGLLLLVTAVERAIRHLVQLRLKRTANMPDMRWTDHLLNAMSTPLSLFIRVYGFYWALSPVLSHFDDPGATGMLHRYAGKLADFGGTVALFWFVYRFIHVIDFRVRKWVVASGNNINEMLIPLVSKTVRGFVIVVGGMMVVQNMTGIEIGPLVASLGIGGLAFALAGKDSIANFLGSLTILFDKPFHVGERIVIDKHEGVVEGVGFRSTRLRTLSGNLVSIPNEKIINSTLENIGKRSYLRWHTNLAISCETPVDRVQRAVEVVEEILKDHEGRDPAYPPRVHFNSFNDWSLNIAVFAWYFPPDYWKFQTWVQRVCLEIMRRFKDEGIEMAYPTQAVYSIEKSGEAPPDGILNCTGEENARAGRE